MTSELLTQMTLGNLDDQLVNVRSLVRKPRYRERILAGVDAPGGLATMQVLRAVEQLSLDAAPPSVGAVAARLLLDQSTVSRAVNAAAKANLLEKHAAADDGRRVELRITALGADLLRTTSDRRLELLAQVTSDWPEADVDQLAALLGRLIDGFEQLERQA